MFTRDTWLASKCCRLRRFPPRSAGRSVVAELRAADLAAGRFRQLIGELDDSRVLVGRGRVFDVLLQLGGELVGAVDVVLQHDHGAHDGAALGVWRGDGCSFRDRRMRDQSALDFEGADAVSRRENDVVVARVEPDVTVFVLCDEVARAPPLAAVIVLVELGRREVAGISVAAEERRNGGGVDPEFAVDDLDLDAGHRATHRARLDYIHWANRRDCSSLGLAVAVMNTDPESVAPVLEYLGVERLTGADAVA